VTDALPKPRAITEEQSFELVHYHERDEITLIEIPAQFIANICSQGTFNRRGFSRERQATGNLPAWP